MSNCENYVSEEDIRALKESEQHIEHVARSRNATGDKALSVTDSIRGESVTNRTLDGLEKLYTDKIESLGYQQMGDYATGINITGRDQIVFHNGSWYMYRGELPHITTGATLPDDGGIYSDSNPDGLWVDIGDAGLRSELFKDSGASLIGYKKPYEGAVHRTAADYFNQEINIDDFGAKGDALLINGDKNPNRTDDSAAIQNALVAAYRAGGVKVTATPWKSYYVANKIFTLATGHTPGTAEQNSFPTRRIQVIDFQGARFIGKDDVSDDSNVFIESGYIDTNGDIKTVFGQPVESQLTYGTKIGNLEIINFNRGFRLRNHVYGCELHDVMGVNTQQIAYTERCFVTNWNRINATGSYTDNLPRYHFRDNSNIMPMYSVNTGDHDVGILFEGATESVKLINCGIENYKTWGIKFSGAAYNVELDSCYIESNSKGISITGNQLKHLTVSNTWFFGDMFVFGDLGENINIRWMPNNIVHQNTKMWKDGSINDYNLSDFTLENSIQRANEPVAISSLKAAMNVHQILTAYDQNIGITDNSILGKIKQCNGLQPIKVNGRTSKGYNVSSIVGSKSEIITGSSGKKYIKYTTGITYNDSQLIYVSVAANVNWGKWYYRGLLSGNSMLKLASYNAEATISASNENNILVLTTSDITDQALSLSGGEIRII